MRLSINKKDRTDAEFYFITSCRTVYLTLYFIRDRWSFTNENGANAIDEKGLIYRRKSFKPLTDKFKAIFQTVKHELKQDIMRNPYKILGNSFLHFAVKFIPSFCFQLSIMAPVFPFLQ